MHLFRILLWTRRRTPIVRGAAGPGGLGRCRGEPIILGAGSLLATSSLARVWVFLHPAIQTAENNINRRNQRLALRGSKSHTSSEQQGVPGCGAFQPRLNGKHLGFLPICNFSDAAGTEALSPAAPTRPPQLRILGLNEIECIRHEKMAWRGGNQGGN